jgi:hypothetical protein
MNKFEIQNAFTAEIMATPEYQIVLKIKDFIMASIAAPLIQETLKYDFEEQQNYLQLENIRLSQKILFGFTSSEMTADYCIIDMIKFLD